MNHLAGVIVAPATTKESPVLPCRFQFHHEVAVYSEYPKRDFTGRVVGIHFTADGITRYDVRGPGGDIITGIDQLDVSDIAHPRTPRATRAQKELTC